MVVTILEQGGFAAAWLEVGALELTEMCPPFQTGVLPYYNPWQCHCRYLWLTQPPITTIIIGLISPPQQMVFRHFTAKSDFSI